MKRLFVTQRLPEGMLSSVLRESDIDVEVRDSEVPLPPAELAQRLSGFDGVVSLLTDRLDASVLTANPQLQVVSNVAVGYDNIDVAAAGRLGITVTNTPDVLTETTADLALALMLGVARRLTEADAFVRSGTWQRWELFPAYIGSDLHSKTLGIFGMGRIGRAVARRAVHGFGMNVVYTTRTRMPDEDERALHARYVEFETLLRSSDVLSLHAPLTPETHHVIGAAEFAAMRQSAILVNTARGRLVDETALASALTKGELWGAGLDVFEDEPEVNPDLLDTRQRVVLAPHIGSATSETRRRMVTIAIENARAVVEGRAAPNPVAD